MQKKRSKKRLTIKTIKSFRKSAGLVTMHGLQPWQNAQFGSKIKIPKKHVKNDSYRTFEFFGVKKGLQKTLYTRKMTRFRKSANLVTMHGLYIAFAKCSVLGQNLKCYKKHLKKRFYKNITVVLSQ